MICETCQGKHGWWLDAAGCRIPDHAPVWMFAHAAVTWRECNDCIGGIASCCDGAGSTQPEPGGEDAL